LDPIKDQAKNYDFDPVGNGILKATGDVITLVATNSACLDDCSFDPIVHGRASRLCICSRGKVSVTFNIHNEHLSAAQFGVLEARILADSLEAAAAPHLFSLNLVGDFNIPPPGTQKRKLDAPAGPAPPSTATHFRPFYERWTRIFADLHEIATDGHTHINTATMTTGTLDRIFTSLPRSANTIIGQTAAIINSPMYYLAEQISDHAPLIWTLESKGTHSAGTKNFTARPEWIAHPVFLKHSTMMSDAIDFTQLSLADQKSNIILIARASAIAARDAIAFADPTDISIRMMRLNSIAQAIFSSDTILASKLIKHSAYAAGHLCISSGKPSLISPSAFEEEFADARRCHINRERENILKDFECLPETCPQKKSKLKNNTKKAICWRKRFSKVTLIALRVTSAVAMAVGMNFSPPPCRPRHNPLQ
jgi:endonuclease/exonuclease/phosphatase family metal-dependent hydrolase